MATWSEKAARAGVWHEEQLGERRTSALLLPNDYCNDKCGNAESGKDGQAKKALATRAVSAKLLAQTAATNEQQ